MGALDCAEPDSLVTPLGRLVDSMGVDIRVARMVVFGIVLGCPVEAIILGAAISVQVQRRHIFAGGPPRTL